MVKKASSLVDSKKSLAIDNLANELSEKPYGATKEVTKVRTTISLDADILEKLEDFAKKNKREKGSLKSVSAIARAAIDDFIMKYEV
ncbi:hypothetical protein VH1709_contig00082-0002 [Vibrio harveyi]|uniref:hypothetical protein n=1 Tax=Vibrio TaxID=662 RepID=UPI0002F4472A|nr:MULTISPECIES: hypothetical protein [Vibrio]GBL01864.1 hypothetical protein VH1709_contig00082-0002 [Vibrio harveyi]